MESLTICDGGLDTSKFYNLWESEARAKNCGAMSVFSGVVRIENGISALSFDVYMPLLESWFGAWQVRAEALGAKIFMAHARGDVSVGESSYMCAIISPNRRAALELYENFIEDFKHNAPIWKYEVINGRRIYAKDRSQKLPNAGILG